MHRLHVVTLVGLLSYAAQAEDAGVSPQQRGQPVAGTHPLAGTWKLDRKASSDLSTVLEHFDASFVTRKMAGSVAPTNVITWKGDRFDLEVRALTSRVTTVVLDGVTPTKEELFGNPYRFTSTLDGDAVVSTGSVTLKDGGTEQLHLRRTVEPDGTMQLRIVITTATGASLEIRRVFHRVGP